MLRKRSGNNERREGKRIGAVRVERIRSDGDGKDGHASSREEKDAVRPARYPSVKGKGSTAGWSASSTGRSADSMEKHASDGPPTPPKIFESRDKGIWDWESLGSVIGKVAREMLDSPTKQEETTGNIGRPTLKMSETDPIHSVQEDDGMTGSFSRLAANAFDAIDNAFGKGLGQLAARDVAAQDQTTSKDHPDCSDWRIPAPHGQGRPASGHQRVQPLASSDHLTKKISDLQKDNLFMEGKLKEKQELIDAMDGEIAILHEKCRQLLHQNERLKKSSQPHASCTDAEDQLRYQVEALLREKSVLAKENARLARENESMQDLLSYCMEGTCETEEEDEMHECKRYECNKFASDIP